MRHPFFLILPLVVSVMRSLAFGLQLPSKDGAPSTIPAETEYEALVIAIFCLAGLVVSFYVMAQFPELGATIAELNQF